MPPNSRPLLRTAAIQLLLDRLGPSPAEVFTLFIPGRVNLIGEHIDYHNLAVLPMALQRGLSIAFRLRSDNMVQAVSASKFDCVSFPLQNLDPDKPGCWANYLKAAVQAAVVHWGISGGIDAAVISNLPVAAGLSSSSALMIAFALALLVANRKTPTLSALLEVMPDAEHYVGTKGGAMDHAAILGSRAGCASRIQFNPVDLKPIPIPAGWNFLIAHSLTVASKSAAQRELYNSRREAGAKALEHLGASSYPALLRDFRTYTLSDGGLTERERGAFQHVTSEAMRVGEAVTALQMEDYDRFGTLLLESHQSLRDNLEVSCRALDQLVEAVISAGAAGARLTGAGFGGCVVALCRGTEVEGIRQKLIETFYADKPEFNPANHLFVAEPSDGAWSAPQSFDHANESNSHND